MASIKPTSRYAASRFNPSSSTELTPKPRIPSRPIIPAKSSNFSSIVKKLVEHKSSSELAKQRKEYKLVVPPDSIANDLKKTAKKTTGSGFGAIHKKLFKGNEKKALTEMKGNARTLAMVLRSEWELLSVNKEQENQILELKLMLEEKNREVEKLKDLYLKQREDIKSLKSAVLFPEVMNLQVQEILENQGSELKPAKQLIPNLQRQVTSLTDQLQCLAEDLAEVKAEKYSSKGFHDNHASSLRTPEYDQEEAANSLEFSYGDQTTPGSPDDMFLKDLNPCLTPYSKTKSKEFDSFVSPDDQDLHRNNSTVHYETSYNSCARKVSKSSDRCQCSESGNKVARRFDENTLSYGKKHNL